MPALRRPPLLVVLQNKIVANMRLDTVLARIRVARPVKLAVVQSPPQVKIDQWVTAALKAGLTGSAAQLPVMQRPRLVVDRAVRHRLAARAEMGVLRP